MIVAFEGIDGAGKTTLAPLVATILRSQGIAAQFARKRAPVISDGFAGEQLRLLAERLWGIPHDARLGSLGTRYWIYLNAAYFSGLHTALSRQEPADVVIIVDNWINKFVARVAAEGQFSGAELESVLTLVPRPDLIVLLDVDPAVAAQRKLTPSELEQGVLFNGELDFVGYQRLVRAHLLAQAKRQGWPVVSAGARRCDDIAAEAVRLIHNDLLKGHEHASHGPRSSPARPGLPCGGPR